VGGPPEFSRAAGRAPGTARRCALAGRSRCAARGDFPVTGPINKKRKLLPGRTAASSGGAALPSRPTGEFRNFSRIPFRRPAEAVLAGVFPGLRADSPEFRRSCLGTFLHVGPERCNFCICYYHQDLHRRPLRHWSPSGFAATAAPAYPLPAWTAAAYRCCA